MFFKEKKCESCGEHYDEMLDFCPKCKTNNIDKQTNDNMTWLPVKIQLFNFLIGFIGLNIIVVIFTVILSSLYSKDEVLAMALINSLSYLATFLALLFLNFRSGIKEFFISHFKDKSSYFYGVIGGIIIILVGYILSLIASIPFPNDTSGNQVAAVNMVNRLPLISIIVLGIMGPIVEELAYRVGLFNLLCRTKIWIAYLLEAVFFALLHFDFTGNILLELINLPSYLFAGLALSYIYKKYGLGASITAHVINNVFSILSIIIAINV